DDPGPARHLQPVYGLADFLPRHADLVHEVRGALGRSRLLVVGAAACTGSRDLSRDVLADGAAIDFGGHVQARHGQHAIGRLKNLGAGVARCFGRAKTKVEWMWYAAVANLSLAWAPQEEPAAG